MKVLLTGATGFLGFRTLERLAELPSVVSIIATGRTLSETRKISHPKVKYILGDLRDQYFVSSIFKEVDIVINTASLSSPWGSYSLFYSSNVLTQKNILKASYENDIKKIIYISTPSVYCNGKDRILVKESEPLPKYFVNNYSATKREAEILLENSGLNYIIIRPRAIIGRGDTVIMPRLIKAHAQGKLKIIGNGNNIVDLTSVNNVVESILLSIYANESALNQTYNITDDNPIDLWKAINMVFEGIGKNSIHKKVNYNVAKSFASLLEKFSKLVTKKEPTLTKYSVDVLSKNFTLDITRAKQHLNYKPISTTHQSILEFIEWFNGNYEN